MGRPRIVVVSPHPDDAAFSVAYTVRAALARGVAVHITTVFSASAFAPFGPDGDAAAVTALRRAEDQRWVARLGRGATLADLALPDAALTPDHLGDMSPIAPVMLGPADSLRRDAVAALLAPELVGADLVLAPLGLGQHLDHVVVRDAVLAATAHVNCQVLLFEDLPYAAELDAPTIRDAVAVISRTLGRDLKPFRAEPLSDPIMKYRDIMTYPSQIDSAGAWALVAFSGRYARSERLWGAHQPLSPFPFEPM